MHRHLRVLLLLVPLCGGIVASTSGCHLTPAQVTTDAGVVGSDLCALTAAISKIADPNGAENNVLGIVCPDIAPTVAFVSSFTGAAGKPVQCSAWAPLDDSKRIGGNGKARAGQVVCANLKAGVEAELAKPPAARRGAKGPVGS